MGTARGQAGEERFDADAVVQWLELTGWPNDQRGAAVDEEYLAGTRRSAAASRDQRASVASLM
ncbi:MAG TPA: hypothetical protein VNB94_04435 [Mycobacteriales bacterium]|nr:hypothetical protein [Mycobacteriales bacterium]